MLETDAGCNEGLSARAGGQIDGRQRVRVQGAVERARERAPAKRRGRLADPVADAIADLVLKLEAAASTASLRDRRQLQDHALVVKAVLRSRARGEKISAVVAEARDVLGVEERADRARRLLRYAQGVRRAVDDRTITVTAFVRKICARARSLGFRAGSPWEDPLEGRDPVNMTRGEIEAAFQRYGAQADAALGRMEAAAIEAVQQTLAPHNHDETPGTARLIEVVLAAYGLDSRGMFDFVRKAKARRAARSA